MASLLVGSPTTGVWFSPFWFLIIIILGLHLSFLYKRNFFFKAHNRLMKTSRCMLQLGDSGPLLHYSIFQSSQQLSNVGRGGSWGCRGSRQSDCRAETAVVVMKLSLLPELFSIPKLRVGTEESCCRDDLGIASVIGH